MIAELQRLAERAFIHKLKENNPELTPEDTIRELNRWYKLRPGAEHGDGVGRVADPSRFDKP